MSTEQRRKLGAIGALAAGIFVALALLPIPVTGPLGSILGQSLWRWLGVGALGIPLLGIGLALAGFDHLPKLSMPRVAALIGGLSVIVPFILGVVFRITPDAFLPELENWDIDARLTGLLPGFLARGTYEVVGFAGGLLVGFLLLSAVTLGTIAWHPLKPLERGELSEKTWSLFRRRPAKPAPTEAEEEPEAESEESEAVEVLVTPSTRKAKRPPKPSPPQPTPPEAEAQLEFETGRPSQPALPPLELLNPIPGAEVDAGQSELDRLQDVLLDTLKTFKVECRITGRTTGPVVTQFEVVPAPGVKVGRIAALADDLALAMHAPSIRIVAPIPGRGAVGVEVPNPTPRLVAIRSLIESPDWTKARTTLPIVLGRDLEGRPVIADLGKMPHLLIAGATGSGKSVAINTIITSLIYRYVPGELQFLMIDPKMVELSMYNALPHLRHKVVTNNHEAAKVLKWAVMEMDRRYELLHANKARNVADFNRKVEQGKPLKHPDRPKLTLTTISQEPPDTPPDPEQPEEYTEGPLPLIVIIVDELADLMMTVQGEIEAPLAMLAQKARAIGIHLLLATQRPSVNVITGLIKANFPSRIAFRVASKVDSRTILDQNGAEALLGNGDMLFLPPGKSEPLRLQGAFIATDETERIMRWYDTLALEPRRTEDDILDVVRAQELEAEGGPPREGPEERDALFREAAEACLHNDGGSTSLLQRRLKIGYGRAARIVDQLEEAGILGPPDGSKPRELLIGFDQLDEYST
ncbi:MAG: DNA translocase FtsK [Gemmatimonadales bacterium]|nr:DNA translocase FtsK [Gemmatimonadales bacterium]